VQRFARFLNKDAGQVALLIGSGVFRSRQRLTGFRNARNIVCIRTKRPAAMDTILAPPE
jgi:hypothetical protein